jgi:diacylglycerol kinase (ATP)
VVTVFRTEKHMRVHFVVALLVTIWAILMRLPILELLFVWSAILIVIVAEMLNTALEDLVDMITSEYDERAKRVKDIAAGIVLTTCVYAIGVFVILFVRWFDDLGNLVLAGIAAVSGESDLAREHMLRSMFVREMPAVGLGASGLVMLALLIIIFKERIAKGTFVSGGWVSGHATVSFYIATLLTLTTWNPWVLAGSLVLALLVAQSRVEGDIHTWAETGRGAAFGSGLALLLFVCGTATISG